MSELHVIFQVDGTHYAVAARDVIQLESYGGATPVPGAPPWVQGLVQIRGNVVPVIDLRRRFGLPSEPPTLDSRVIVVRSEHRVVGLLADRSREVVALDPKAIQPPPEVVQKQARGFVRAVAKSGERLLMLVDFEKIIGGEAPHGE